MTSHRFVSFIVIFLSILPCGAWIQGPCMCFPRKGMNPTVSKSSFRLARGLDPKSIRACVRLESFRSHEPTLDKHDRHQKRRILWRLLPFLIFSLAVVSFPRNAFASEVPVVSSAVASTVHEHGIQIGFLGSTKALSTAMELKLSVRLLFASLVGAAVGWERSATHHSAGVRTMALVSLGAAAFTICSMYGFLSFPRYDPSRMASNVASGVGFIGAGVITTHKMRSPRQIQPNSLVHGLTTAAAIWLSAAVGVASGAGLYVTAGTAALATIGILRFGRVKHTNLGKRLGYTSKKSSQSYGYDSSETHDLLNWDENLQDPLPPQTIPASDRNIRDKIDPPVIVDLSKLEESSKDVSRSPMVINVKDNVIKGMGLDESKGGDSVGSKDDRQEQNVRP